MIALEMANKKSTVFPLSAEKAQAYQHNYLSKSQTSKMTLASR